MHPLAALDHRYIWHPFTQMRDWLKHEPIIIAEGRGAVLRDVNGRQYLDANSSIWTNLHGHNHPRLNTAVRRQLNQIAHSSALGLANKPASLLARDLIAMTSPPPGTAARSGKQLTKVFFSDNGSTAIEVALKLAYEFSRRTGRSRKPKFLSLQGAYHGDTVGAVALGHIDLFHNAYAGLLFKSDQVMAPYCYRCPFNRAKPERSDAREYRKCHWECVDQVEQKFVRQRKKGNPYAGFVFEPLIQGAAGMIAQPAGWLKRAAEIAKADGSLLIADEVLTGLGRTGTTRTEVHAAKPKPQATWLLGAYHEGVQPDLVALAKGLAGGYMPLAATLTTQQIFDAFLGKYSEFKTFFHGHSFTANPLACATALANLELLRGKQSLLARERLQISLSRELQRLWQFPQVGDIRQVGLIAGIELVKNWRTREPFSLTQQAGIRVCEAMARRGVLTRPIGNVVVMIPPYCTTSNQARQMVNALADAIQEVL